MSDKTGSTESCGPQPFADLKVRLQGLSLSMHQSSASPKNTTVNNYQHNITLSPLTGAPTPAVTPLAEPNTFSPAVSEGSRKSLLASPSITKCKHNEQRSSPSLKNHHVTVRAQVDSPNSHFSLRKTAALPKLCRADPDLSKVVKIDTEQAPNGSLLRSNSLLATPTVSPLKQIGRSRSSLTHNNNEALAVACVRQTPSSHTLDPTKCRSNSSNSDSNSKHEANKKYQLDALDRSVYYQRKGDVADVLMEWDYKTKTFVAAP
mmetsp:Transcript_40771/g.81031  ORF Transcript_40771/g.81031 Transcript_40771/m.81031 type:complete len:262 (-) Transcript_40771:158-943(-)